MPDPAAAYRSTAMHTASRGEILLAMYDGALRHTRGAREAIVNQDSPAKGRALDAAMAILTELSNTLDTRVAPELCANLQRLYAYFLTCLQQAGLRMEVTPLDEVIVHLQALRETWAMAVHQSNRGRR